MTYPQTTYLHFPFPDQGGLAVQQLWIESSAINRNFPSWVLLQRIVCPFSGELVEEASVLFLQQ